jgi:2-iminobutanoate/2-iminopropanoate deaminase
MKSYKEIPNLAKAVGPYSIAVETSPYVFISGQLGIDPSTSKLVSGGIEAQARQVLTNLKTILEHLSLDFSSLCKCTIFLCDLQHFQLVNGVYSEFLGQNMPARSTIQVAALPLGAEVEIEAIAVRR